MNVRGGSHRHGRKTERTSVFWSSATVVASLALIGSISGCSRSRSESSPAKQATSAAAAHDGPRRVRLTSQVISEARIKTARVTKEVLSGGVDLPGEIAFDPDRVARIASPLAGRIERVLFKEGSVVSKGDALAVIRVPELGKLRSAHASTVLKAKAARSNADRLRTLRAEGLAGEQEMLNAEAEAQAFDADAHALGEQLGAIGMTSGGAGALLTLRASLSGVAVTRDAVAGQPIGPDQSLGTIADLASVWFLGRVFERNIEHLRLGARAKVSLDAFHEATFDGTVSYLGKQIDPTTRTLTARIQILNPKDTLRIGLYGVAHVLSTEDAARPAVVVVPRTAVMDIDGKSVVFVATGKEEFEVQEVTLGEGAAERVEIRTGLAEGQEVVVDGGFTIKSAVLKSTFAEEE